MEGNSRFPRVTFEQARAQFPVLERVAKEDADKAKAQLEDAGATVELK